MVEIAQASQLPISLDVSAVNALGEYGVNRYREALKKICPAVLMANGPEGEALGFAEKYPDGVAVVVHHRGPDPTRVFMTTGDFWEVPVPYCDNVVDTVGAGDVFAGGFLVGWVQGRSLRGCIEIAHDVAVKSVQQYGVEVPRERPAGLSEVG
jgi:sugar/nucleoside kinase (ribokinase family)